MNRERKWRETRGYSPGPSREDLAAFDATDRACALLDWRYAVWDRLDGVVMANQKWLAGYQHPRCFNEPVAERLQAVFARPRR